MFSLLKSKNLIFPNFFFKKAYFKHKIIKSKEDLDLLNENENENHYHFLVSSFAIFSACFNTFLVASISISGG